MREDICIYVDGERERERDHEILSYIYMVVKKIKSWKSTAMLGVGFVDFMGFPIFNRGIADPPPILFINCIGEERERELWKIGKRQTVG